VRLVVDASILVAELLRARGRELIAHPALQLYLPTQMWEEATHELAHRVDSLVHHGRLSQAAADDLLAAVQGLIEKTITIIPDAVYEAAKERALTRVPRDPNDWPVIALAMMLDAGIWSADTDFLGCGVPVWTTDTLLTEFAG